MDSSFLTQNTGYKYWRQLSAIRDEWLNRCINKNQNVFVALIGQTGTGKSWGGMALGEFIDVNNSFNSARVCMNYDAYITAINNDTSMTEGSVIVIDEAQVSHDSQKWQDLANIEAKHHFQTAREFNHIVVFTAPDDFDIMKGIRKLFHYQIRFNSESQGLATPYRILGRDKYGRDIKKYMTSGGEKLGSIQLPKPSRKLVKDYKKMRMMLQQALAKSQEPDKYALTDNQRQVAQMYFVEGLTQQEIAKRMDKSQPSVAAAVKALKRKGYILNHSIKNDITKNNSGSIINQTIDESEIDSVDLKSTKVT